MNRLLPSLVALVLSAPLSAFDIVVNVQHASCGTATGNVYTYATGGVPPYMYSWNTGVNTASLFDVVPGFYTLTVTDASATEVMTTVEVIATTALFPPFTPSGPAWACDDQCTGNLYIYIPLPGLSMNVEFDPPGPVGNASPNGLFMNNMCPGVGYMVTVSDINGCSSTVGPIEVLGSMAPEVVNSTITGSCPGGATGSMLLEFNDVDSLNVSGPNGNGLPLITANPLFMDNLAPGTYTVYAYVGGDSTPPGTTGPSCSATIMVQIPVTADPCGSISGVMYADIDGSCTQEAADLGLPYRIISIEPGGHLTLTNAVGEYATELFYDDYTLDASVIGYAALCPTLPAAFTLSAVTPSATIDLAMDPLFGPDVRSHLSAGVHRPGFPVVYTASAHNEGPYGFFDLTLDLYFDPLMTLVSAPGSPILVGPGHLQWEIASQPGFSSLSYAVEFTIPANASLIGTVVNGSTVLSGEVPDADPDNNVYTITRTIVGAYDPNDKLAETSSQSSTTTYYLQEDAWIDYTVRFQNTGTAEAINVHILDTIAPELDILSLQILATSHAFEASLLPGRVLRFDFPNIMLPDSTTDLNGSQGFASFRLRPVGGVVPGTLLTNAADIYFDFNEPIRTNDAELVVEFSTGVSALTMADLRVYPNPVNDQLICMVPDGRWIAEAVGMDGRVAITWQQTGDRLTLDAASLAPGSYALRLTDNNGDQLTTRFVKQ